MEGFLLNLSGGVGVGQVRARGMGRGQRTETGGYGWSLASNAGGVTANLAHLCPSSPIAISYLGQNGPK